jgi:hypothetical protein
VNGHSFKHGFGLGFSNNHLAMMNRGRGFGFFPPFQFLFLMVILGLFIWFGYRLFKGNDWQLSLTDNLKILISAKPVHQKMNLPDQTSKTFRAFFV